MSDEEEPTQGQVIGIISPGPTTEAPPLFKLIPKRMRRYDRDKCQHSGFRLDSEWNEVSCGSCGQVLDAFAVLERYADWWQDFDNRRISAEEAEKRMEIANLRRMRKLRGASDQDRVEIDGLLSNWSKPLGEIREASRRIEREIKDRKREVQ